MVKRFVSVAAALGLAALGLSFYQSERHAILASESEVSECPVSFSDLQTALAAADC